MWQKSTKFQCSEHPAKQRNSKAGNEREEGLAGEGREGEKEREEGKQFHIVLNVQFVLKVRAFMKFQILA